MNSIDTKIKYTIQPTTNFNRLIEKSDYTSDEIIAYINRKMKYFYLIQSANVAIYLALTDKFGDDKLVMDLLRRIYFIRERTLKPKRDTKIYIWLCDLEKELPGKSQILGKHEINSGCCVIKSGDIYIWRREDINHIVLHEMIHSMHWDIALHNRKLDSTLAKKYNVASDINSGEIYTDVLATLFELSLNREQNKMSNNFALSHIIAQSYKILKYYDYQSIGQLEMTNQNTRVFEEDTNVFSYYIMRPAVLLNMGEFIEFIRQWGLILPNEQAMRDDYIKLLANSFEKYRQCDGEYKNTRFSNGNLAHRSLKR